ncbi:TPA: ead/Ea22-like family protein [Klebsiella pneumoniae]|nr:ead/Ea22-like family protein [Klebsiella pneumoniae]
MTDITELAQRMKAAAEKATPGPWYVHDKPCEDGNYGIDTSDKEFLAEAVVWWGFARQSIWREEDAKYIALANPANILALVEALEKAQQRIAELESRAVTVGNLQESAYRTGLTAGWNLGLANNNDGFNKCLAAHTAGIKVEAE